MTTQLKWQIRITVIAVISLFLLGIPATPQAQAQNVSYSDSTKSDSTKHNNLLFPFNDNTGNPWLDNQNQSPLFLRDPSNLTKEIQYNPETNSYEFVTKIGDFTYRDPVQMDFEDFKKYTLKNDIKQYWKERAQTGGTAEGQRLIPKIYIGGEAFDKIFGSNTIDIRPQGSAEVSFGILSNKRDDPSLDVRQRRTTNFDFNEKIQMNVIAKIGDKIEFKANYNTESSFDFENTLKLKYEGKEDEIIKLIEAGNVTLPLNSTLITGSQSLFGIKTKLQFGNTTITGVFSQQQSETKNISVQGGAQTQNFELTPLDYEENRHFFLSQYFRDNYERALADLPIITSDINITKIEVWVTNIGAATQENRNIVAFTDLGEGKQDEIYNKYIHGVQGGVLPSNRSNDMLSRMDTTQVRDINSVTNYLTGDPFGVGDNNYFVSGEDFVKLENARKLKESEYTLNRKLGFISLNTNLNPDQVLAVAVQYTVIGHDSVFQIGEFSDQGVTAPKSLIVKLLKSTSLNTKMPMWNLMMKNVYAIGAYQVNREDFIFNILYKGDNQGVPTGYFMEGPDDVKGVPLIHLLGLDNLDQQMNPIPGGDGVFDFIDGAATNGGTIQANNGRIFFTSLEPFGKYIRDSVFPDNKELADKYAFDSLYTTTKTGAEQFPDKNKFILEGFYKSSSGSDISLNAMNVPQGSVKVTAGGVVLTENVDYTVDYTLGRVKIINEGILNSGTPINVSLESNSMFNVQQKRMMGIHVDHEFSKNFHVGGTILNLHERPLTQKVNYGDDPVSNTVWGADFSYHTDSRWLTNIIDKLPGISTNTVSKINLDGEFAQFLPGHSKAVGKSGTSYIDDFEGAKSSIDLKNVSSWFLASTPQGQPELFPEVNTSGGYEYGKNRAKFAWYIIDPLFYDIRGGLRPKNVDKNEISKNSVRKVLETELFPNKDIPNGTPQNIPVLNLAFFPDERGPYNYDVEPTPYSAGMTEDGNLAAPETRWGGIMRKIETSDFEASNIEYIEFWMMDPFTEDADNSGELYIDLGDVSEDILRDGRKSYENGLPTSDVVENVDTTLWGRVPNLQALVESFSNVAGSRKYQDVGYDGLGDEDEQSFYEKSFLKIIRERFGANSDAYNKNVNDPSADDFHYFRGSDYDVDARYSSVTERYKKYNGPDGNSPTDDLNQETYPTAQTNIPNVEDINRDNTLSESERYFQYKVKLDPNEMEVGKNHIVDIHEAGNIRLDNGDYTSVKWYQFKIPVQLPDEVVGNIADFRSIRFMRLFMRGFKKPIICRLGTFELVRGEWRRYQHSLLDQGEYIPGDDGNETNFVVSTVNIEENAYRTPVHYVVPPGIRREVNFGTTNYVRQNEQALSIIVDNLLDGDARGVYKNTDFDFRQYKKLKMYVHAEKYKADQDLNYGDLTVLVRIGSDFTQNYYEYEVPLEFTEWFDNDPEHIWPENNRVEIDLEKLVQVKQNRNVAMRDPNSNIRLDKPYVEYIGKDKVTVVGNPSISDVDGILIGIRNPKKRGVGSDDSGEPISATIWVNELRLTDFNNTPGWATTGRLEANLADLGRVQLTGLYKSAGFGTIDQRISDIPLDNNANYTVATDMDLGRFFGEKTGIKIPMHFDYGKTTITPKYNPMSPDIKLKDDLDTYIQKEKRDSVMSIVQDYTTRTNINFMNVRKERTSGMGTSGRGPGRNNRPNLPGKKGAPQQNNKKKKNKKPRFYDIENFDVSFAYTKNFHRNIDIEYDLQKKYRGGFGYNFNSRPKAIKPFEKVKVFSKSKWFQLIKDFNFYALPKVLSVRMDMDRQFNKRLFRDKSFGDIITYPTYTRIWNWNRDYDFKYDLSKSLTLEYAAGAKAFINEPQIYPDKDTQEWEEYKQSIWREIYSFGTMQNFNQSAKINYNVPLKKLPLTDWIKLAVGYQAQYNWTASPLSIQTRFGNNIENSSNIQVNSGADMKTLYGKIPYLKKLNRNNRSRRRGTRPTSRVTSRKKSPEADTTSNKPKKNYAKIIGDTFLKVLMSVQKASLVYKQSNGTLLPGFLPQPDLVGINMNTGAPGLGFVFGSQRDIRYDAAVNGWLTKDTVLNKPYITKFTEQLSYKVNAEILKAIKIDVDGDRIYARNYNSYYRFDPSIDDFNEFTPQEAGNFSISYPIIKTSFDKLNSDGSSPTFELFKAQRRQIADRLAAQNPYWSGEYVYDSLAGAEFPLGYGSNQQEVLYYSFISAYSGQSTSQIIISNPFPSIPLPNWRITFNGLTNLEPVAKIFRTVNITHGYRSMLSVNSWQTNVLFDPDNPAKTYVNSPNFVNRVDVGVVSIIEQYSPLIGVDVTMKNSFGAKIEFKKTRNLSMSFVNNQMTEIMGNDVVVGLSYRLKGIKFTVGNFTGAKPKKYNTDVNMKLDFTMRDSRTTLRRIDEQNDQISAGAKQYALNFSADYMLSQSLQLRAYFNWASNNPYVSSQYPNGTTSGGFTLRFNLAQ